jgi:hypothetical protein
VVGLSADPRGLRANGGWRHERELGLPHPLPASLTLDPGGEKVGIGQSLVQTLDQRLTLGTGRQPHGKQAFGQPL